MPPEDTIAPPAKRRAPVYLNLILGLGAVTFVFWVAEAAYLWHRPPWPDAATGRTIPTTICSRGDGCATVYLTPLQLAVHVWANRVWYTLALLASLFVAIKGGLRSAPARNRT